MSRCILFYFIHLFYALLTILSVINNLKRFDLCTLHYISHLDPMLVGRLSNVRILKQEIKDLNQTLEEMYQSQQVLQAQKGLVVSPAGSPEKQEKQHLIMELAESKAKARKLRQQL